jgi:hypothetical protein
VFGLGEERNGSRPLFFLRREVSGRERPGCGLLLPLPLLRERLSLAGVGDAAGGGRFCGAASPLLLIAGRGSVDGAAGSVGVSLRLAFPRPREAAAGEAVSRCWREWNRLGEGRGRWGYGGG